MTEHQSQDDEGDFLAGISQSWSFQVAAKNGPSFIGFLIPHFVYRQPTTLGTLTWCLVHKPELP